MSYSRHPIYIYSDTDNNIICTNCGMKVVGHSDEDAYKHMIWHAVRYFKVGDYEKEELLIYKVRNHLMLDILDKKGQFTHDDYTIIIKIISKWEKEFGKYDQNL